MKLPSPRASRWFRALLLLAALPLFAGCRTGREAADNTMTKPPAVNVSVDPWKLATENPYRHHGAYLGNGVLGMRFGASGTTDSPDGQAPANAAMNRGRPLLCIAAGLYAGEHLVAAPNWGAFRFEVNGAAVEPEAGTTSSYRQTLDLRRGELTTAYRFPARDPVAALEMTTRVHRDRPDLVTIHAVLTPVRRAAVTLRASLPLTPGEHLRWVDPPRAVTSRDGVPGIESVVVETDNPQPPAPRYLGIAQRVEYRNSERRRLPVRPGEERGTLRFDIEPGKPVSITKWVCIRAASRVEVARTVSDGLTAAMGKGIDALAASHREAWTALWTSDIEIEGDLEAQHVVRSSLFYLLCSASRDGRWSIPPMGLSGTQWGGHIFWDADTWMFPVLALLHPDLALPIVDYRHHTLDGAKRNASANGYRGADYATESAVSGVEIAPAEFPYHDQTSADVAIAQWRHFLWSGDRRRLETRGFPILRAAAEYYRSRVIRNTAAGRYEIRRVISPDETAKFVDNDVYTNAAAKTALRAAVSASRVLGKGAPPEWRRIADGLWLPFDEENRRYLEHEGYKRTRRKPKQADAQLLFFPLGHSAPRDVVENTLSYYAAHTSPIGPAMTSSVHAVIAARLAAGATPTSAKWRERSLDYFRDSYRPFTRPPFNDFSEKRTMNNTTFLTGCAGVLMGPLYGFAGIDANDSGVTAKPSLPAGWKRLRVTGIHYRGRIYDLEVTEGHEANLTERAASAPTPGSNALSSRKGDRQVSSVRGG